MTHPDPIDAANRTDRNAARATDLRTREKLLRVLVTNPDFWKEHRAWHREEVVASFLLAYGWHAPRAGNDAMLYWHHCRPSVTLCPNSRNDGLGTIAVTLPPILGLSRYEVELNVYLHGVGMGLIPAAELDAALADV